MTQTISEGREYEIVEWLKGMARQAAKFPGEINLTKRDAERLLEAANELDRLRDIIVDVARERGLV